MNIPQRIAILATTVLGLVMVLQLLLAAGFPLGHAAWGGQAQVLPPLLRWASLATVGVLGLAAWIVLARANLAAPGAEPVAIRVVVWVFAGFLSLNTLGNIASSRGKDNVPVTKCKARKFNAALSLYCTSRDSKDRDDSTCIVLTQLQLR